MTLFTDTYAQTFVQQDDGTPPGAALSWDGRRLEDLPTVTAELLDQLVDAQDAAESRRAPMPTLKGWIAGTVDVDAPIEFWPVAS